LIISYQDQEIQLNLELLEDLTYIYLGSMILILVRLLDKTGVTLMAEGLHEECGIVGIYDPDENCVRDAYYSMIALQHRGQESCGIAVNKNRNITYYKDLGLVNEVFNNERLEKMKGSMAVGHVRYSTTGESIRENSQPLVLHYLKGNLAIAHNGNLINSAELRHEFNQSGPI